MAALLAVILLKENNGPVMQDPELDYQFQKGIENNLFAEDNENCLVCHGEAYYELADTATGIKQMRRMLDDYRLERDEFYLSNHWSFACTDCHSYDFEIFPHPTAARLEEPYNCNDCHGYDEQYAHFRFEEIQDEYDQSVHAEIEGYSCWKCHDPHEYEVTARNTNDFDKVILYGNNICLECHANYSQFRLLTDREETNIVEMHEWLPNQGLHFKSVRCIECHTEVSDSILIAHKVLPAEKAVRKCTDCHSSDSRLMATLYKFQSMEDRKQRGFLNAIILNQSFVIGANRNIILNILSLVIFGGVIMIIAVHTFFRIIRK